MPATRPDHPTRGTTLPSGTRNPLEVVLVGAGHTHLHVVDQAPRLRAAGVELTLVAPSTFVYSGRATLVAAGLRHIDEASIDVADLARRRGVRHLATRVTDIDAEGATLTLAHGEVLPYRVVSLNLGSVVRTDPLQVGGEVAMVKPFERLLALAGWLASLPAGARARCSIVGGGPTGLELAGLLTHRWGDRVEVTVFESGPTPGASLATGARRAALRQLRRRGARIRTRAAVTAVHDDHLVVDGTRHEHDAAVLATGLIAPPLVAASGLGDARGIPVTPELVHPQHRELYAVGDAARFTARPLPKLGVHGVRQGPVLVASLLARAADQPLPVYRPQRVALQILDLGGGRAVASRGRWWLTGRAMARLKDGIDQRWLDRYRAG
ncbi:MAG: NAD(P)/FAD-dependent oxidoreductase [Nitriliruptoraceae bacterium]